MTLRFLESTFSLLIGLSEVIPSPTFHFWLHIIRANSLQSVGALCYLSVFFGISGNLIHLTRVVSAKSLLYEVATFVFMVSNLLSDSLCGVLLVLKFYL